MRRFLALSLIAALVAARPFVAQAAGDASAIRRATRTEDSRWVSNYRPGQSNYRGGSRGSQYRRYSANGNGNAATGAATAKSSVAKQPAKASTQAQSQSKSPVR